MVLFLHQVATGQNIGIPMITTYILVIQVTLLGLLATVMLVMKPTVLIVILLMVVVLNAKEATTMMLEPAHVNLLCMLILLGCNPAFALYQDCAACSSTTTCTVCENGYVLNG